MHTQEKPQAGTYRRPTPEEVAYIVKEIRTYFGWKQLALAMEAGVTDRTIERIEAAEKVSDDTLRKVAKALKLRESAFLDSSYVPSPNETMEEVKRIHDQFTVTDLHDFSDSRDFANILGAHAYLVDGAAVDEQLAGPVAAFTDQVRDFGDIYHDIPNTDRLEAGRELLAVARDIESHGYTARWGTYRSDDGITVAVVVFLKHDGHEQSEHWFKKVIVPRKCLEHLGL